MIVPMNFSLTRPLLAALLFAGLVLAGSARAQLSVEIIGSGAQQFPIAIVPFRSEEGMAQKLTPVIAADLARSGLFRMVDPGGVAPVPHEPGEINYEQWRARGAEALVIGSIAPQAGGRYEIRFRLMDATKQTQLVGIAYTVAESQLRLTAHKIADAIYEKLTGDVGV